MIFLFYKKYCKLGFFFQCSDLYILYYLLELDSDRKMQIRKHDMQEISNSRKGERGTQRET